MFFCPPSVRARLPPSAAFPIPKPPKSSALSTTPSRVPPSSPSALCSPRYRAAARFHSVPGRAPNAANSSSMPASAPSTVRNMSANALLPRPSKPPLSANTSLACSSRPAHNPSSKKSGASMVEASGSPLAGRSILITRASEQTESLVRELEARGAKPVLQPMISFHPPHDLAPLDKALRELRTFDWLLLTSANAVRALVERSQSLGVDVMNSFAALRIAAVGPVTAEAARRAGLHVSHVATKHQGLALAEEFAAEFARKRILLPRSNLASAELPDALRRIGANVTEVIAYRTFAAEPEGEGQTQFFSGRLEAILFFSPSAVRNFLNWDEGKGGQVLRSISDLSRKTAVVAVGPVTASALRDAGLRNIVQASNTTVPAVIEALEKFFAPAASESKRGEMPV